MGHLIFFIKILVISLQTNLGESILSYADIVYKNLINDICANGTWDYSEDVRTHYKDGEKAYAKSLFDVS